MGCPIHGHPAMACEFCEAVAAQAITTARAEGYAHGRADAEADAADYVRKMLGPCPLLDALRRGEQRRGCECHVGAAKKGGS